MARAPQQWFCPFRIVVACGSCAMVDTLFWLKIKPPLVIESLILAKLSHVYVMPEGRQVLLQNRRWAHVCSRIIISGGHWMLRVEERDRWWYNILYLAWNSCHFWLMGAYSVRGGVLQFWNWFSILPTSTLTINMGRFNKLSPHWNWDTCPQNLH